MPAFNSAPFIADAINSVRSQTLLDWELIIYDDASTDGTVDIASRLAAEDSRLVLLRGDNNRKTARARNTAIQQARGRYIAFLDSDDLWKPEKLEKQITFMREGGHELSFTSYDRIDEVGRALGGVSVSKPVNYDELLKWCCIGCLTAVYDTELIGKHYAPDIPRRQDFALWLAILKRVDFAWPMQESLAIYRVRKSSLSSNKLVAARYNWMVYRDIEELSLLRAAHVFAHYAVRGVWRTYLARPGRRR